MPTTFRLQRGSSLSNPQGRWPRCKRNALNSGFDIRINLPRSFFFGGPVPHDGLEKSAMWKKSAGKLPDKTQWKGISSNFSLRKLWSVVFSSYLNGLFCEEMVVFCFLRLELANVPTAKNLSHLYRLDWWTLFRPHVWYICRHVVK